MPQNILNDLDVQALLTHSCCKGMPQNMTTERWEQNHFLVALLECFIITITNNPSQSLVERSLMLGLSKAINKDEIRISINRCFAMYSLMPAFWRSGGWQNKRMLSYTLYNQRKTAENPA